MFGMSGLGERQRERTARVVDSFKLMEPFITLNSVAPFKKKRKKKKKKGIKPNRIIHCKKSISTNIASLLGNAYIQENSNRKKRKKAIAERQKELFQDHLLVSSLF